MVYIVYNPAASNKTAIEATKRVISFFGDRDMKIMTVQEIGDELKFCNSLIIQDTFVLIGGNGTLNHFVNSVYGSKLDFDVYYYPSGAGSDFSRDVRFRDQNPDSGLIKLNNYLEHLPVCTFNGKKQVFINGVGFGIDGYVCEKGNELRDKTEKEVNYANIAIGGILGKFHPCDATLTIDGVVHEYKSVWLIPTMIGRFMGGGMLVTPDQNRFNSEHTVSTMIWHTKNPVATMMNFSKIFSGDHLGKDGMCEVLTGHHINVKLAKPQVLQIDGDTYPDVTEYSVDFE